MGSSDLGTLRSKIEVDISNLIKNIQTSKTAIKDLDSSIKISTAQIQKGAKSIGTAWEDVSRSFQKYTSITGEGYRLSTRQTIAYWETVRRQGNLSIEAERGVTNTLIDLRKRLHSETIGTLRNVGIALTAFGAGVGLAMRNIVMAGVQMESLMRGLASVSGSAKEAETQLIRLKEVAKLPGLGLPEAIKGSTNLQATGMAARLAERALMAFGNALASVGKGRAELDGVILALTQISAKGKVSAEEINQLAERLPQIRKAMKDAFGTANTEELQKRNLSPEAFIEGIIKQFEKLTKVTTGGQNSIENFQDALLIFKSTLGKTVLPEVTKFLDAISKAITQYTVWAEKHPALTEALVKFGIVLAGIGIVGGPLSLVRAGIMSITASIPKLITQVKDLSTTITTAMATVKTSTALVATGFTAIATTVGFIAAAALSVGFSMRKVREAVEKPISIKLLKEDAETQLLKQLQTYRDELEKQITQAGHKPSDVGTFDWIAEARGDAVKGFFDKINKITNPVKAPIKINLNLDHLTTAEDELKRIDALMNKIDKKEAGIKVKPKWEFEESTRQGMFDFADIKKQFDEITSLGEEGFTWSPQQKLDFWRSKIEGAFIPASTDKAKLGIRQMIKQFTDEIDKGNEDIRKGFAEGVAIVTKGYNDIVNAIGLKKVPVISETGARTMGYSLPESAQRKTPIPTFEQATIFMQRGMAEIIPPESFRVAKEALDILDPYGQKIKEIEERYTALYQEADKYGVAIDKVALAHAKLNEITAITNERDKDLIAEMVKRWEAYDHITMSANAWEESELRRTELLKFQKEALKSTSVPYETSIKLQQDLNDQFNAGFMSTEEFTRGSELLASALEDSIVTTEEYTRVIEFLKDAMANTKDEQDKLAKSISKAAKDIEGDMDDIRGNIDDNGKEIQKQFGFMSDSALEFMDNISRTSSAISDIVTDTINLFTSKQPVTIGWQGDAQSALDILQEQIRLSEQTGKDLVDIEKEYADQRYEVQLAYNQKITDMYNADIPESARLKNITELEKQRQEELDKIAITETENRGNYINDLLKERNTNQEDFNKEAQKLFDEYNDKNLSPQDKQIKQVNDDYTALKQLATTYFTDIDTREAWLLKLEKDRQKDLDTIRKNGYIDWVKDSKNKIDTVIGFVDNLNTAWGGVWNTIDAITKIDIVGWIKGGDGGLSEGAKQLSNALKPDNSGGSGIGGSLDEKASDNWLSENGGLRTFLRSGNSNIPIPRNVKQAKKMLGALKDVIVPPKDTVSTNAWSGPVGAGKSIGTGAQDMPSTNFSNAPDFKLQWAQANGWDHWYVPYGIVDKLFSKDSKEDKAWKKQYPEGTTIPGTPVMLEHGGIATRPTFAMIGEKGPEAVVPLGNYQSYQREQIKIRRGVISAYQPYSQSGLITEPNNNQQPIQSAQPVQINITGIPENITNDVIRGIRNQGYQLEIRGSARR